MAGLITSVVLALVVVVACNAAPDKKYQQQHIPVPVIPSGYQPVHQERSSYGHGGGSGIGAQVYQPEYSSGYEKVKLYKHKHDHSHYHKHQHEHNHKHKHGHQHGHDHAHKHYKQPSYGYGGQQQSSSSSGGY